MKLKNFQFKRFTSIFIDRFFKANTTTWAASIAFYTALSLAPLLILFVTFSAQLSPDLQKSFVREATLLVGPQAGQTVEMIINSAEKRSDLMSISGIMGVATLLLSASFIFGELRAALNQMFDVNIDLNKTKGMIAATKGFIQVYIFQMGLAFSFLFIMIVSLIISTALSATVYSNDESFKVFFNIGVSLTFYSILFTLLFHFIPSGRLTWRRARQAGFLTACLFVIGKEIIGLYLGNSAMSSAYGAAGSLVVLLAWVYYSALIVFIGAHCAASLTVLSKEESHKSPDARYVPLKESHANKV